MCFIHIQIKPPNCCQDSFRASCFSQSSGRGLEHLRCSALEASDSNSGSRDRANSLSKAGTNFKRWNTKCDRVIFRCSWRVKHSTTQATQASGKQKRELLRDSNTVIWVLMVHRRYDSKTQWFMFSSSYSQTHSSCL